MPFNTNNTAGPGVGALINTGSTALPLQNSPGGIDINALQSGPQGSPVSVAPPAPAPSNTPPAYQDNAGNVGAKKDYTTIIIIALILLLIAGAVWYYYYK